MRSHLDAGRLPGRKPLQAIYSQANRYALYLLAAAALAIAALIIRHQLRRDRHHPPSGDNDTDTDDASA